MELAELYLGPLDHIPMGRLLIKLDTEDDGIIDDLYNDLNE